MLKEREEEFLGIMRDLGAKMIKVTSHEQIRNGMKVESRNLCWTIRWHGCVVLKKSRMIGHRIEAVIMKIPQVHCQDLMRSVCLSSILINLSRLVSKNLVSLHLLSSLPP
jgi:hypothetical protein